MPAEIDRSAVETARSAVALASERSRALARQLSANALQIKQLLRTHAPNEDIVRSAQAESVRLTTELQRASEALGAAQTDLSSRLRDWLAPDAQEDLSRLSAALPILLFPVRVETRFVTPTGGQSALKVRVFPDAVLADAHDPVLSRTEYDAGVAYWQRAWIDEAQAWRELLQKSSAPRAAWIVLTTQPTNLAQRPTGQPDIPQLETRLASWDRPPECRLLPDRWLVLGYRERKEVLRAVGTPVQQPLAVAFDPRASPSEAVTAADDGIKIDPGIAWTMDFARAEKVGMALTIPLDAEGARRGFDRLLIFGTKVSSSPEASRDALGKLFDNHHYSGGLAFIAQGTPTNNAEDAASGYPPPDPDGTRSFSIERGNPLDTENGDGARLMRALGLPRTTAAHLDGANRSEQRAARAMNAALWPGTWGYFLSQMMAPHINRGVMDEARKHFVEFVRGRGPLPALRVRGQPYGVLPVCSLERFLPRFENSAAEKNLPPLLRQLLPHWTKQVPNVPRVGRTPDADADLLGILGMDASTREVRVRRVLGPDFQANLFAFLDLDHVEWLKVQNKLSRFVLEHIGHPDWRPRIARMTFGDRSARFNRALVAVPPLSESSGLSFDYVRWILEATVEALRAEKMPAGQVRPQVLLYRLLRHARLVEFASVGLDLSLKHKLAQADELLDAELHAVVDGTAARSTVWQRLAQPIPALTGQVPLSEFLRLNRNTDATKSIAEHDAALKALAGMPTAELHRVFTETLDLCSHRLDAWITSLATQRLVLMRNANPDGIYLGAYAWLEDLRPADTTGVRTVTLSDGKTVQLSDTNAGHIHAPSLGQATAAAVLRNAYRTRGSGESPQYAIDLSSRRVRTAVRLLDAVRQGQSLGALLGYQFERGLHEGHRPLELSRFIEPLRHRFPLVANKSGDTTVSADAVAARNVVDGLALLKVWKERQGGLAELLANGRFPTQEELLAVADELRRTEETLDSVADLLTSEAVYRIVNGDPTQANASLDAMAKGSRPPEATIVHQPRPAIVLTHRVAIVLGGNPPAAAGWDALPTPRSLTEPSIDGWAGQLLGDPDAVRCRVTITAANGAEARTMQVTLAQLGLRPIDFLALTVDSQDSPLLLGELEQRIVETANSAAQLVGDKAEIVYARDAGSTREQVRTFPEIFELAKSLNNLLANARALAPTDFTLPQAQRPTTPIDASNAARATNALESLRQAQRALNEGISAGDATKIATALRTATLFGIPGAFLPKSPQPAMADLTQAAELVLAETARRITQAEAAQQPVDIAHAVFGAHFLFLPLFVPPGAAELKQALDASAAIVGDRNVVDQWLHQSARVRPALARWRKLAMYCKSLGSYSGSLDVVQLPFINGARWAALNFPPEQRPSAGTVSLLLHRIQTPQLNESWVGLWLDDWSELIPDPTAVTGIAFHYDTPGAEPPQALLIAVPPTEAERWSLADLAATLNETVDLAKVRAVDGELLADLSLLLPAIFLASNPAGVTVSTEFAGDLVVEPVKG